VKSGFVFPILRVNDCRRTDLQHPCRIADTAAIERHVDDLLFDRRAAACVDKVELKRIVRTVHVEALVALYAGFGFTAFNDVIALTVGQSTGMSTILTSFTRGRQYGIYLTFRTED
jgi:hypothetical protein